MLKNRIVMDVKLEMIINIEDILLQIEEKYLFELDFGHIVKLNKYLEEIGKITNIYFELLEKYNKYIMNLDIDVEKKAEKLKNYNIKINNNYIEYDLMPSFIFIKEVLLIISDTELNEKIKLFSF
jgi:hypothetical protein